MEKKISTYYSSRSNRPYLGEDDYDEFEDIHGGGYDGYGYRYGYSDLRYDIDIYEAINPLIKQLKAYDDFRQTFEERGGTVYDLAAFTRYLSKEIVLDGRFGENTIALTDPIKVKAALSDIDYRLKYQIRELPSGLPCYYLCRIKDIYYSSYNSIIIEDIYISPGYPMPDKRFVHLMRGGKEHSFLRLSPFRELVKKGIKKNKTKNHNLEYEVDKVLYDIGRHLLGAAWHEDQYPGMHTAEQFKLNEFPKAIELLYLDLSGELCELRSQVDTAIIDFFVNTYPNPAIVEFLKKLKDLNGAELNELPKEGLKHYVNLQKAFAQFLRIEIPWGKRKKKMPLNRLLLGNFSRLDIVGKAFNQAKESQVAKGRIEKESQEIIRRINEKKRDMEAK